jgi:hypothetical protein
MVKADTLATKKLPARFPVETLEAYFRNASEFTRGRLSPDPGVPLGYRFAATSLRVAKPTERPVFGRRWAASTLAERFPRRFLSTLRAIVHHLLLLLIAHRRSFLDQRSVRRLALTSTESTQASQHESQGGNGEQSTAKNTHNVLPSKKRWIALEPRSARIDPPATAVKPESSSTGKDGKREHNSEPIH